MVVLEFARFRHSAGRTAIVRCFSSKSSEGTCIGQHGTARHSSSLFRIPHFPLPPLSFLPLATPGICPVPPPLPLHLWLLQLDIPLLCGATGKGMCATRGGIRACRCASLFTSSRTTAFVSSGVSGWGRIREGARAGVLSGAHDTEVCARRASPSQDSCLPALCTMAAAHHHVLAHAFGHSSGPSRLTNTSAPVTTSV